MLPLLTDYLLTYKQVAIPSIGNLAIRHEPAAINFGEKLLMPPLPVVTYSESEDLPEQQLSFLALQLNTSQEEVVNKLHAFGNGLRSTIQGGDFQWNGIGNLTLTGNKIAIQSRIPQLLQPVSAQKVIREDARHMVRRGEDQVDSSFQQSEEAVQVRKTDIEWLAWLLVVLAALFILFCFYQNNFSLHTTGLRKGVMQNLFYQNQ